MWNRSGNPSYSRHRQELTEEELATSEHTVNNPVHNVNTGNNYLLSHVNTTGEHTSATVNKYQQPEGKKKRFNCWYTNADPVNLFVSGSDPLTNKLSELTTNIKRAEIAPSIIAITEAEPKKYRYQVTAAEFKIDGYDIFTSNIPGHQGRGIIVYTASELRTHEITLNTKFDENLTVCLKLENDDKLMVTWSIITSHGPSSPQPNNKALCDLISEIDRRPETGGWRLQLPINIMGLPTYYQAHQHD